MKYRKYLILLTTCGISACSNKHENQKNPFVSDVTTSKSTESLPVDKNEEEKKDEMSTDWLNPQKANSHRSAHFVHCENDVEETFLSFPNSHFDMGSYGSVRGDIGTSYLAYRKKIENKFQFFKVEYPALLSNGPATTLIAYDYGFDLNSKFKTYNFTEATVEQTLKGKTSTYDCLFYINDGYEVPGRIL